MGVMRLRIIVVLGAVLLLFALFAPVGWGGSSHYLRIRGTSMEPSISAGDVVVVREQSSYQVGDVIAYRSEMAGAVVLHRVVATLSDGYLLQGDNNSFVDRDLPSRTEVLGRKVLLIPRGERLVAVMSAPWMLMLLSTGVVATWFARPGHRMRGRRVGRRRAGSFG